MNHYIVKIGTLEITMEYESGLGPSVGLALFDPNMTTVNLPGVPIHVHERVPGRINPRAFGARVTYPEAEPPKPKRTVAGDTGLEQTELPT